MTRGILNLGKKVKLLYNLNKTFYQKYITTILLVVYTYR